ncbi:hypothetical protein F4809DRAFT_664500 [Biscogniauxia mediterranea]|nr:hypothetical protein F4809DRAFT_664500 [Biscogniauxia mediterranea]
MEQRRHYSDVRLCRGVEPPRPDKVENLTTSCGEDQDILRYAISQTIIDYLIDGFYLDAFKLGLIYASTQVIKFDFDLERSSQYEGYIDVNIMPIEDISDPPDSVLASIVRCVWDILGYRLPLTIFCLRTTSQQSSYAYTMGDITLSIEILRQMDLKNRE